MAERDDVPHFGDDYDLARWSTGETDPDTGLLVWHEDSLPGNDQWSEVRIVTLNFDPDGEGDFRNYHISPDRPLDPWNSFDPDSPDADYYFDLDDLAGEAMDYYGFAY